MTEDVLAVRKQTLVRLLLQERGLAAAGRAAVSPRTSGAEAGLAPAQSRLWFQQRLEPSSGAYNLTGSLHCKGVLDVGALDQSIQDLVRRHEILRTVYRAAADGSVRQVVVPDAVVDLPVVTPQPHEVDALVRDWGRQPFDLEHDLPVRVRLLRLAEDEHLLVVVVHHIAFDDDSWGLVMKALAEGYARRTSEMPALQYADYAEWLRNAPAEDDDLDYWCERLTPPPPPLRLPVDFPRRQVVAPDGVRRSSVLPPELGAAVRDLARRTGVTLNMLLLAVFKTWLHRTTGGVDVAVGTPVVHRDRPELVGVIGNFGNMVVLRTEVSGDLTFRELLARVRTVCAEGYAHQGAPFEKIVERLRPPREPGRTAFFDVMFSFVANAPARFELPGLVLTERPVFNGTARFDLVFECTDNPDGLVLTLTGRADMVTEEATERLLGQLTTLVSAVVDRPDRRLCDLPLLKDEERERALRVWSGTRTAAHENRPLSVMFEDQVRRTPDAVAVTFEGQQVTYEQLNRRANRLARHLRTLGVGPERTVGLHLERSAELITGLLAVLKAGGAFVPLEPAWPARRIAAAAEAAEPVAVLSTASRPFPSDVDIPVVLVDNDFADYPDDDFDSGVVMENIAYVIFTSGSTGVPKGAAIRHQSICDRLPWQVGLLGLTDADAVLHKAPLGFDISVNEILLPLVRGARLVVAPPGVDGDVSALLQLIADERVTFLYVVASMLDVMLDHPKMVEASRSLRHVWCGGEALTPALYARFRQRVDATMYHGYGPAETTIGVCCGVFTDEQRTAAISIGTPNPNSRVYLLDPRLNPVPVGVPGEIYIGGTPLARAYAGDPVRTSERFVADPFRGEPGARLYRTGDLGRYRADGLIEFLGRGDGQVKLRGRRIELAEIEAALAEHPGIRHGVVLVRDEQLVAFCLAEGTPPAREDLRGWVGTRLPEYMVPRTCVVLTELPLTPAGKVDRSALTAMPSIDPVEAPYLEPRERYEREVTEIWQRVLEVDRVGTADNFFDLGGHSLLLVKVQALCLETLGREVSVRDLVTHTTVAALARMLREGTVAVPVRGAGDRRGRALARQSELARRAGRVTTDSREG